MTWLINVTNAIFLIWIISAIASRPSTDCPPGDDLCADASDLGTSIGVGIVLILWFIVFVVEVLVWFMTRPQRRLCPACGKDVKQGKTACPKCGHDFAAAAAQVAATAPTSP